jgi:hypothetical protein
MARLRTGLGLLLIIVGALFAGGLNDTIQCGHGIGGRNNIIFTDSTVTVYIYCLDDSLNNGEFTLKRYEYYVDNKKIKLKKVRKANKTPAIYVPEKFDFEEKTK